MAGSGLDDATWASLLSRIHTPPGVWKGDETTLRRFVEAALRIGRTGAPWRDPPADLGCRSSLHHRRRRWCLRGWWGAVFEHPRPPVPADGLVMADGTTCSAKRTASSRGRTARRREPRTAAPRPSVSAARAAASPPSCTPAWAAWGGCCASPSAPASTPTSARAPPADPPAPDAVSDRGYVSAKLRCDLAAQGCTAHVPPERGMARRTSRRDVDPPAWDARLHAKRHLIEDAFRRTKGHARLAPRRGKTRQSFLGFAHLAATLINPRWANFSHRP